MDPPTSTHRLLEPVSHTFGVTYPILRNVSNNPFPNFTHISRRNLYLDKCKESRTHDSSDVSKVCGGPQTHTSSETLQGTPQVVPDTHCPAMVDVGVTAMSHGSGIERTVQQEYFSAMSRDESPTPGL